MLQVNIKKIKYKEIFKSYLFCQMISLELCSKGPESMTLFLTFVAEVPKTMPIIINSFLPTFN